MFVILAIFDQKWPFFYLFWKKIITMSDSLLFMTLIGLLYVNWGADSKESTLIGPTQGFFVILAIFDQKWPFLPILETIITISDSLLFMTLIGLLYVNWGADSKNNTLIDPNHNIFVIWAFFKTKMALLYYFDKNEIKYQILYFSWF
jgi:hypothetical protein